ncbi:putative protein kinase RLK-Pelle-CrRLK1L-1 family [Helianthus debilis subsp. tardiflorus]
MVEFLEEFRYLKIKLEDIEIATNKFDANNVIGSGGFGKVYIGEISHTKGRSMAAFKRLDPRYGQGIPEFWNEIMMLSRYEHQNIVSLLGFCDEVDEKILVYKYASHGSLDQHLNATSLTWTHRLKICLAVARAVQYLHDPKGTQQRVLHCDLKSSNILLDKNWTVKVSDFGLSKMVPANQHHTVLITHAVGTPGYCDPLYKEMGLLTKESDIYSLGIVFFEVLCGRLCYEYPNGQCQILEPVWKKSYEQKKLDEIIFQGLMKQMDPNSLESFANIAYWCLNKSYVKRPTISHVVKQLEIALEFQEIFEVTKQPKGYKEIIKAAIPPLIYRSIDELRMLLSKGIFLNNGRTWLSINKNGERCEMISATECLIHSASGSKNRYSTEHDSRFAGGCYLAFDGKFKTYVKTQFLLPQITYTINLVFKFIYERTALSKPTYSALKYKLEGDVKPSISYFADDREDGWLMAELYQFTNETRSVDLKIIFEASYSLAVEGIEFRALEKVKHEVLEDENIDMQSTSDSEIYWEQKVPKNYEEMIKLSKDRVKWTTKKELFFILRKGFQINDGKEVFDASG